MRRQGKRARPRPGLHQKKLTLRDVRLVVLPLLVHRDRGRVVFYPRVARLAVLHLGLVVELEEGGGRKASAW